MDELTIGELAELAGVATSTLRYYESIGILPPPRRTSGQRRYSSDVLQIMAVIQLAKDAHFSLPEIKALLYDYSEYSRPSERWKQLAQRKLREVEEMIARSMDLKQLLEEGLESDALLHELDSCASLIQDNTPIKREA